MRRFLLVRVPVVALGLVVLGAPWQSAPAAADVTFSKDVAPILNAKCVGCHRDPTATPPYYDFWNEPIRNSELGIRN